jgi:hypothetical protein
MPPTERLTMNGTTSRGPGLGHQTADTHQGMHYNPHDDIHYRFFTPVRFPCSIRTYIYLYLTCFLRSIIFSSLAVRGYLCALVVGFIRTTDESDFPLSFFVPLSRYFFHNACR